MIVLSLFLLLFSSKTLKPKFRRSFRRCFNLSYRDPHHTFVIRFFTMQKGFVSCWRINFWTFKSPWKWRTCFYFISITCCCLSICFTTFAFNLRTPCSTLIDFVRTDTTAWMRRTLPQTLWKALKRLNRLWTLQTTWNRRWNRRPQTKPIAGLEPPSPQQPHGSPNEPAKQKIYGAHAAAPAARSRLITIKMTTSHPASRGLKLLLYSLYDSCRLNHSRLRPVTFLQVVQMMLKRWRQCSCSSCRDD